MSKTVVWSSDIGEFVEASDSEERGVAIQKILDDLREDPASGAIEEERQRARLRWADLRSQ